MNEKRWVRLVVIATTLVTLAACNREAQPSVSPVGSWQGALTTMTSGSGTQPFTAEITEANTEDANYAGVFAVGEETYNVTGFYNGTGDEGDLFIFSVPWEELQPAVSPVEFYGMMWSGPMTEDTYSGGWFFNSETSSRSPAGAFSLERLP